MDSCSLSEMKQSQTEIVLTRTELKTVTTSMLPLTKLYARTRTFTMVPHSLKLTRHVT